jgi:hypothetical protein
MFAMGRAVMRANAPSPKKGPTKNAKEPARFHSLLAYALKAYAEPATYHFD